MRVELGAGVIRLEPGATKNQEGREFPFRVLRPLVDLLEAQRERTRELEPESGQIILHVFHRDGKPIPSLRRAWEAINRRHAIADALAEGVDKLARLHATKALGNGMRTNTGQNVTLRYVSSSPTAASRMKCNLT